MKDDNDKSQLEMKERKKMNETGKRKKAKKLKEIVIWKQNWWIIFIPFSHHILVDSGKTVWLFIYALFYKRFVVGSVVSFSAYALTHLISFC